MGKRERDFRDGTCCIVEYNWVDHWKPNILDGSESFYEREKLRTEIEQNASEDQKYNALHFSCGDVFNSYLMAVPKIYQWVSRLSNRQTLPYFSLHPLNAFICGHSRWISPH